MTKCSRLPNIIRTSCRQEKFLATCYRRIGCRCPINRLIYSLIYSSLRMGFELRRIQPSNISLRLKFENECQICRVELAFYTSLHAEIHQQTSVNQTALTVVINAIFDLILKKNVRMGFLIGILREKARRHKELSK